MGTKQEKTRLTLTPTDTLNNPTTHGIVLPSMARPTISSNLGRLLRSRCQQSIIRWYRASGQSIGPGNL
ncbi:hypothetical protein EYF80_003442 [Liparis tanakae]|uniref:Uncharacterized protein n=1 Tax=Liparis tanakae TaxID=230148 RepID=A0A4Z2J8L4_9TELE|nr:hypothetical protein EYF80_003442 [Liparis tanakae]